MYERSSEAQVEDAHWLRIFHRVGLIQIYNEQAVIREENLDIFNAFLMEVRGENRVDRNGLAGEGGEVGKFAEELAVSYEIKRLQTSGHSDLALLVQRISEIDRSAGYDIMSRRGAGRRPEDALFIEVKGTTKATVNFVWSRNEREVAAEKRKSYWIYVFTHVDLATRTARGPVRIMDPARRLPLLGFVQEPMDVLVYLTAAAGHMA